MQVRKFVIYDGQIRMGVVELHRELLPEKFDRALVQGGGRWEYDPKNYGNKAFFFGKSFDFGPCKKDDFFAAWDNSYISPALENAEIYFSDYEYISQVLEQFQIQLK